MAEPLREISTEFLEIADKVAIKLEPKVRKRFRKSIEDAREEFTRLVEAGMTPLEATESLEIWELLTESLVSIYADEGVVQLAMGQTAENTAIHLGGAEAWEVIEPGFWQRASTWAEKHGSQLVTNIKNETRDALRKIVAESFSGNQNFRQLNRRIVDLPGLGLDRIQMGAFQKEMAEFLDPSGPYSGYSSSQLDFAIKQRYKQRMHIRSRRIATTEAGNAVNAAQDLALREMSMAGAIDPDEFELEWVGRMINVCPICEAFDAVRRPMAGGLFVSREIKSGRFAGMRLSFERPLAHPNCYCGIRTVRVDSEIEGLPVAA